MKIIIFIALSVSLMAQSANVQIVHNSPYPTVDIYVDGVVALEDVEYRQSTELLELPTNTTVGIAPAGGDVIASFDFALEDGEDYVVVASGIVGNETTPFDLKASVLETEAEDEDMFALQVMHGVTDAPAVDIYANGVLLVENLAYGDFTGYVEVPAEDYTLDITVHGEEDVVASFSAPLTGLDGGTGLVYASGFLTPTDQDSAFTLMLTTPSGYVVELPGTEAVLELDDNDNMISKNFTVLPNYPNPFNPQTSIRYNLDIDSNIKITVYDLLGNVVNELFQGFQSSGNNSINWDATNNTGQLVSSGVYIYKIQTDDSYHYSRMMYLK